MSVERTWHEQQLLEDLKDAIEAGEVEVVEDPAPLYGRLVEAFPVQMNRINWDSVPGSRTLEAPPERVEGGFELVEPASELRAFWERMRRNNDIGDDMEVVVLGDSLVGFGLRLSVATLTRHLVDVLSIPHHTYVFPEDLSWCFNYTPEDDAFFGSRAVDSSRKRSRSAEASEPSGDTGRS